MSTKTTSNKNSKSRSSGKNTLWWILGGVVGLGLIVWMAFAIAGEGGTDESIGFGEVTVEGEDLPFFDASAADPAVGQIAPTVSGTDWNDAEHTIAPGDTAKIVVLLAHWCPHCQAEVPIINQWLADGNLPEDVEVYGVTVLTNRLRDGSTWPPGEWLDEAGWTSPTIMDDENGSAATAYGLTSTPTYVVLGPDNENLGRYAGEIGVEGLNALAAIAADSVGQ